MKEEMKSTYKKPIFKGLKLWHWFRISTGTYNSLTIFSFFICHEYPHYNQQECRSLFYFCYGPGQDYECPKDGYYFEGKSLRLELFGIKLIDILLFRKEVEMELEDQY